MFRSFLIFCALFCGALQAKEFDQEVLDKSLLQHIETPFFIPNSAVQNILSDVPEMTVDDLLLYLVPLAQQFARPAISGYHVGAVGLGASGNIYIGVNLEFSDLPSTIHAEQFMVVNARNHQEIAIDTIALSAAPCGHCRQFLSEIANAGTIRILTPENEPTTLGALLPHSFGPQDLGLQGDLLSQASAPFPSSLDVVERAREAALCSYAPYTNKIAGVAFTTLDGNIYSGSVLENAAYNPTVPPFTSALVDFVTRTSILEDGEAVLMLYSQIDKVVLVEFEDANIKQT
ncbi:MAG: cytidine deaminase, partial [Chlamydiales bacterium]|nr:cytidine deaminase [Chlamydiales bacterium]